jgi:hypothetical protein
MSRRNFVARLGTGDSSSLPGNGEALPHDTGSGRAADRQTGITARFHVYELASGLVRGERRFSVVCGEAGDCGSVYQDWLTAPQARMLAHALNEVGNMVRERMGFDVPMEAQIELEFGLGGERT